MEYQVTHKTAGAVGVDEAKMPTPPPGKGWKLIAVTVIGAGFWYWWQRPLEPPKKTPIGRFCVWASDLLLKLSERAG
jgi:hypothetical protein